MSSKIVKCSVRDPQRRQVILKHFSSAASLPALAEATSTTTQKKPELNLFATQPSIPDSTFHKFKVAKVATDEVFVIEISVNRRFAALKM